MQDEYVLDGVEIKKYGINEGDFESMESVKSNCKQKKDVEGDDVVGFMNSFSDVIK